MSDWRNRIVGYGDAAPGDLTLHPQNWRSHPKAQAQALTGVLGDIGWIAPVIVNRTSGHVIDGHLRIELALSRKEPSLPVAYVELTEAEEAEALLTFDPLGAMAMADKANLDALLRQTESDDAAVQQLLDTIAQANGLLVPDFEPVGIEDQGRLDEKKRVRCPECGHEFAPA